MSERWFITGTDTEVGKTIASCTLLQVAKTLGLSCVGYKLAAFGCEVTTDSFLRNSDALALQRVSSIWLPYEMVISISFY